MFKCWSQTICSFGSAVQSKQRIINKIAGSEKNLWLCSESIKWKSTSGSLKTQSHLYKKKKKNIKKKWNQFPQGELCCQKLFIFTSCYHSFVCEVFLLALLSQHESLWVTQRGSGMEANLGCMLLWDLSSGATSAFLTVHIPGSLSFSASLWRKFISWKYIAATWDLTHRCLIFKQFSLSKVLLCICCVLNFPLYTLANEGQQHDKIRVQQVVAAVTDGS